MPSVNGRAGVEEFAPHVDAKTKLVSVAWVSNVNGYRHDLKALADLAHSNGALLYADAVQALGAFPVNLRDEGVDLVSSGTYKWLFGGFGIAPFFLREEHLDRIRPDRIGAFSVKQAQPGYEYELHDGARAFEYATLAFAPLYMLGAGLEYLERVGLDRIEAHTVPLAHEMRSGVADLGFEVLTPEGNRSPIVAFRPGCDMDTAREVFERHNVALTVRTNLTFGVHVRAGAALFNNREDVQPFLVACEELRAVGDAAALPSSLRTSHGSAHRRRRTSHGWPKPVRGARPHLERSTLSRGEGRSLRLEVAQVRDCRLQRLDALAEGEADLVLAEAGRQVEVRAGDAGDLRLGEQPHGELGRVARWGRCP